MRSASSSMPISSAARPAAPRWPPSPPSGGSCRGCPLAEPPRDLSARVRTGIESGSGRRWWQRPGGLIVVGASLATVAAAVLAVVVIGNLDRGGVGQQSGSPVASVSFEPGPSAVETSPASAAPDPGPGLRLGPGELGYLSLTGAPLEALRLSFINDATGDIDRRRHRDRPADRRRSLTERPVAGLHHPEGRVREPTRSGRFIWPTARSCHSAARRRHPSPIAWHGRPTATTSPSRSSASISVRSAGCPADDGARGRRCLALRRQPTGERINSPRAATPMPPFVPAVEPGSDACGQLRRREPDRARAVPLAADPTRTSIGPGVFLPLFSPDGSRAIFWNGTMTSNGGSWHFSLGGMPQLSRDFRSAGPASPWIGTPLFTDLAPVGGEAFASGDFAWGPGQRPIRLLGWCLDRGTAERRRHLPEPAGRLRRRSERWPAELPRALAIFDLAEAAWIVDVALRRQWWPRSRSACRPRGSAIRHRRTSRSCPFDGGCRRTIGGEAEPPPWNGPAVYGY